MNLIEIKAAVDAGLTVHQHNAGYRVIKDKIGQYLITFQGNDWCIGLTHRDGVTMNGKEEDFYVAGSRQWAVQFRAGDDALTEERFPEFEEARTCALRILDWLQASPLPRASLSTIQREKASLRYGGCKDLSVDVRPFTIRIHRVK